ncbi:type II toxin-antitoxin system VapC family toxin [Aurantimonas endophytica]|uniref:Putative nucleic acid-binding protein n=1 Tax=Aurantimonas endophytica TaxID=1522175 RepID=A0A7W6HE94_9HYPH|nr:PIN domain-containing protein [Aurantimonas endophytica]MBB4003536.1 putative nucleic acid-binding protein [Aurantimonas endophytica]MCO6404395.1 PIN domain-containing protein [Aurantimonas endophytica]
MDGPTIYLDTNVLIALVEPVAPLTPNQRVFVEQIDAGALIAVTSEIALAECLVKPLTDAVAHTVRAYYALFASQSWLAVMSVSRAVLVEAAALRAAHRMALPDAIHVASARLAEASAFVTDDRRLPVPAVEKLGWSDMPVIR